MIGVRCLMVDVDGVVVRRRDGARWDAHLARDLGVSPAALQEAFFAPHWRAIVTGREPIAPRLKEALARIAPGVSATELMNYWFAADAELDEALLEEIAALRAGGLAVHLATVQEHARAAHLWESLGLNARFDAMHYSAQYGLAKPDPAFFAAVSVRTGFAPDALLLLDDSAVNVAAARAAGWRARLWDGSKTLRAILLEGED